MSWGQVNKCLSIKGAEEVLNKPHAFEISTTDTNMYFIADSDKVLPAIPLSSSSAARMSRISVDYRIQTCEACFSWLAMCPHNALLRLPGQRGLDQCSGSSHRATFQEVGTLHQTTSTCAYAYCVPTLNTRAHCVRCLTACASMQFLLA